MRRYVKVAGANPDQSCLLEKPILTYEDIGMNHIIGHLPGNNPVNYGPATVTPGTGVYLLPFYKFVGLLDVK